MALLEIRNVTRRFGDLTAIDNVSFDIAAGEFFSLVGTSGCGKTTLLRMISGLDTPDEGDILLDDKSIVGMPPEERPIHTVFQSYALFPHLTVAENIAFPLRMKRSAPQRMRVRVAEVLKLVSLSDKADRFPHELSGGQRQRVALARAIADLPRILLLDEPLAALDAKLREQMQVELIRLQRDLGIAFIFVTHSQAEALALSHRIAVMNRGQVEQLDLPERIYGYPKNKFVADFIGHCTLERATVKTVDETQMRLETAHLGIVTAPSSLGAQPGQQGWLALRPEQLKIGRPDSFADMPNRVRGKICGFLYVGDVTTYIVELETGLRIDALLANSSPARVRFFEESETVELAWPAAVGRYLHE